MEKDGQARQQSFALGSGGNGENHGVIANPTNRLLLCCAFQSCGGTWGDDITFSHFSCLHKQKKVNARIPDALNRQEVGFI